MVDFSTAATRSVLLTGSSEHKKRQELKTAFNETWALYESLFSLINNHSAYFKKAEPLRHPLIFYYGHTAVFYINKLKLGKYIENRIDPHFESMFAIGVDEMSWDDLNDTHYDWPSVDEVKAYRRQVKDAVNQVIDDMPLTLPITDKDPAWVILMGIEHERIHLETSSVIMRQLPVADLTPSSAWEACHEAGPAPSNPLIAMAGRSISLGKSEDADTYGWDNEYGVQQYKVHDFKTSKYLVSNQEYLDFVKDGGYQQKRYWTDEGLAWLAYTKATMPRFWLERDGTLLQRNLTQEIPLPLNWPVEVNQLEAKAFCNWKADKNQQSIRLPTVAEWYIRS
ncbi:5-histidylcysteine sulfoxide synthase, partial [Photobacterium sp. SP02]|uniref:5-histidylcysteine sulfoxide synthase n=1 Tax=Photobacterium sp. SP02 TaxID=3032280 RepID=UPI0031451E1A